MFMHLQTCHSLYYVIADQPEEYKTENIFSATP